MDILEDLRLILVAVFMVLILSVMATAMSGLPGGEIAAGLFGTVIAGILLIVSISGATDGLELFQDFVKMLEGIFDGNGPNL